MPMVSSYHPTAGEASFSTGSHGKVLANFRLRKFAPDYLRRLVDGVSAAQTIMEDKLRLERISSNYRSLRSAARQVPELPVGVKRLSLNQLSVGTPLPARRRSSRRQIRRPGRLDCPAARLAPNRPARTRHIYQYYKGQQAPQTTRPEPLSVMAKRLGLLRW